MGHIQLARWADVLLIAPASANVMARLAQGQADDLLTTLCLATHAPILMAPAMNQAMWHDLATQDNLKLFWQEVSKSMGPLMESKLVAISGRVECSNLMR